MYEDFEMCTRVMFGKEDCGRDQSGEAGKKLILRVDYPDDGTDVGEERRVVDVGLRGNGRKMAGNFCRVNGNERSANGTVSRVTEGRSIRTYCNVAVSILIVGSRKRVSAGDSF